MEMVVAMALVVGFLMVSVGVVHVLLQLQDQRAAKLCEAQVDEFVLFTGLPQGHRRVSDYGVDVIEVIGKGYAAEYRFNINRQHVIRHLTTGGGSFICLKDVYHFSFERKKDGTGVLHVGFRKYGKPYWVDRQLPESREKSTR
jgi:hypothetical protein